MKIAKAAGVVAVRFLEAGELRSCAKQLSRFGVFWSDLQNAKAMGFLYTTSHSLFAQLDAAFARFPHFPAGAGPRLGQRQQGLAWF
jgi:hypothetical protein